MGAALVGVMRMIFLSSSVLLSLLLLQGRPAASMPTTWFCGQGQGQPASSTTLHLNLSFASPCKMTLVVGGAGGRTCTGEPYAFDGMACYSHKPSFTNCTVQLPNLMKNNGSDCFHSEGIREITYDDAGGVTGRKIPAVHVYGLIAGNAFHATLTPCGNDNHRFLLPLPNGTRMASGYRPIEVPVQCAIAEQKLCGAAKLKGTDACMACAGAHAVELAVKAGCSDADIESFCGVEPEPPGYPHGCGDLYCCSDVCGSFGRHGCNALTTCGSCDCCHWTKPVPGGVACDCSC